MSEIDRRSLLAMLSASVLLAACGGGSSKAKAPSGSTAPASDEYTGTPTTLDVPGVATGHMTDDEVHKLVADYGGKWLGSWADDTGGTGTGDIGVAIDSGTRIVTVDVVYDGPIVLGNPPAPATYRIPLDGFVDVPDSYSIPTNGYGTVEVRVEGFGQAELRSTNVPGHPEIDVVDLKAVVGPLDHASMTYKIVEKNGTTVRGAIAFVRNGDRPPAPNPAVSSTRTDFVAGDYAAGLVSAKDAEGAFGRPSNPPEANGGRGDFAPGLMTSNARVLSQDGVMIGQYTVVRGVDAATAHTFFELNTPVASPLSGLGDDAHIVTSVHSLEVLKGKEVLQLTVVSTDQSLSTDQTDAIALALAGVIAPHLDQG